MENKSIKLTHNELVTLISETVMTLSEQTITKYNPDEDNTKNTEGGSIYDGLSDSLDWIDKYTDYNMGVSGEVTYVGSRLYSKEHIEKVKEYYSNKPQVHRKLLSTTTGFSNPLEHMLHLYSNSGTSDRQITNLIKYRIENGVKLNKSDIKFMSENESRFEDSWLESITDEIVDTMVSGVKSLTANVRYNMAMVTTIVELVIDKISDVISNMNYHTILDIIAIVLYVLGGVLAVTGVGLPIAALVEMLAIVIELGNALSYIYIDDDPNYFMAGLTAAFTVFPIANLVIKPILKPFTSSMVTLSKAAIDGGKIALRKAVKGVDKKLVTIISEFLIKHPTLLKIMSKTVVWLEKIINITNTMVRGIDKLPLTVRWILTPLKYLIKSVLKPILVAVRVAIMILTEMTLYDPQMTKDLLYIGADWLGIDRMKGWGDWVLKSPFNHAIGRKSYNLLLKKFGSIEGVVETTVFECDGKPYDFTKVYQSFLIEKNDSLRHPFDSKYIPDEDGVVEEDIRNSSTWPNLLRNFESYWAKGWRPDFYGGEVMDISAGEEYIFRVWGEYSVDKRIKEILEGVNVRTCEQFVDFYKNEIVMATPKGDGVMCSIDPEREVCKK